MIRPAAAREKLMSSLAGVPGDDEELPELARQRFASALGALGEQSLDLSHATRVLLEVAQTYGRTIH